MLIGRCAGFPGLLLSSIINLAFIEVAVVVVVVVAVVVTAVGFAH